LVSSCRERKESSLKQRTTRGCFKRDGSKMQVRQCHPAQFHRCNDDDFQLRDRQDRSERRNSCIARVKATETKQRRVHSTGCCVTM
jgi:hypothetical protein